MKSKGSWFVEGCDADGKVVPYKVRTARMVDDVQQNPSNFLSVCHMKLVLIVHIRDLSSSEKMLLEICRNRQDRARLFLSVLYFISSFAMKENDPREPITRALRARLRMVATESGPF